MAEQDSHDLGDQLFQVRQHTLERDRVRGQITDVRNHDGSVDVHFEVLTTGRTATETFSKPTTWTTSNAFVRLVEWCGYNPASALQLEGEEIPLRHCGDGDDWKAENWEIDIDRLPGESLVDREDYYIGVAKGSIATAVVMGAGYIPLHFGFWGFGSLIGISTVVIAMFIAMTIVKDFVQVPADDDRRTLSYDEVDWGEFEGWADVE